MTYGNINLKHKELEEYRELGEPIEVKFSLTYLSNLLFKLTKSKKGKKIAKEIQKQTSKQLYKK